MTIGEAIKSIREERGISQDKVEAKTGIKRGYLSKIENGHNDNPTLKTLCKIAEALQVKLSGIIKMVDTVDIPVTNMSV
jgi:transcriptional regulator with XRE-family HTH domain